MFVISFPKTKTCQIFFLSSPARLELAQLQPDHRHLLHVSGRWDTLRYAMDDWPVVDAQSVYTPPGIDQTWDLRQLQARVLFNQVYLPARTGKNAAAFPGAELVAINGLTETYFNVTPSRFETMGFSGTDPFGFNLQAAFELRPPLPERVAPVNFFDINGFSSSILQVFAAHELPAMVLSAIPAGTGFDSLRVRVAFSRLNAIDAYGTIKLPFADYPVLRQKTTQYQETRIDLKVFVLGWLDVTDIFVRNSPAWAPLLGVDTTVWHLFINDQTKEIIAQLHFNTEQNRILQVIYKAPQDATVPVHTLHPLTAELKVFPNPAHESLQLDFVPLVSGELHIAIHDVLGRVVNNTPLEIIRHQRMFWSLPCRDLPAGLYSLVLHTADRSQTVPVVVRH